MTRIRRFSGALVMAALIASCIALGTVPVEAKKPGGDGPTAVCAYLLTVINYPNVNPYIKLWATSLYKSLGCQPALP